MCVCGVMKCFWNPGDKRVGFEAVDPMYFVVPAYTDILNKIQEDRTRFDVQVLPWCEAASRGTHFVSVRLGQHRLQHRNFGWNWEPIASVLITRPNRFAKPKCLFRQRFGGLLFEVFSKLDHAPIGRPDPEYEVPKLDPCPI